jgi:hypothetical protein
MQTKKMYELVVTREEIRDCEVFGELIDQIDESIEKIYADGAYDTRECYEVAADSLTNV